MARAGHPQSCAQTTEIGPTKLATDASAETLADPGSGRPSAPAVALRRSSGLQCRHQLVLLRPTQERNARSRLVPEVFDAVGATLVVAPGDAPDPIGRIAGDAGNQFGGQPAGQEPDEVPATALHRIFCAALAHFA